MPTLPWRFQCRGLDETYAASEALLPGRKMQIKCSKGDVCRSEVEASDIAGLRILSIKNTLPISFMATETDDWLTLSFVERGGQSVERRGGETRESVPGRCVTGGGVRPGDAVKVGANCARRIIYVPPRQLNDVIARHFHVAPPRTVELLPSVIAGARHDALYELTRRAVVGVETTADGPFDSIVAKQYCDLLISSLLLAVPNTFSDALGKASGVATNRYVKRALDFMRANVDQPIDIDDIARNAACSPRRLQLAFRAQFGLTPMAFLKEERLKLAERRLRMGECDDVTSLAHSLGFSNPGRFAGDFRQKFGILPSEILCSHPAALTGEPPADAPAAEPRRARDLEVAAK